VADPRLARLFADVWEAFLGGAYPDTEVWLERTGLVEWRGATEQDIAADPGAEVEEGDPLLCLTEEGKRIVREGREPDGERVTT
jgi:hypothetical protein